jgi:phosphopantothenoylcysteine synthetase/decarboxylase
MKVLVTCGPSFEPIDQVRRLTNFSTGELGVHLSDQLARADFEVFCLKGSGATYSGPSERCHLFSFRTNNDLLDLLTRIGAAHKIDAVFMPLLYAITRWDVSKTSMGKNAILRKSQAGPGREPSTLNQQQK